MTPERVDSRQLTAQGRRRNPGRLSSGGTHASDALARGATMMPWTPVKWYLQ
eukprot:CAMPEP_0204606730 /NCGR_PEP_ID=MMETSP0661-20131031/59267_1 /ASSEMBLY_ACC=CAM_ASM_000606 /TAXON_ID=109239 /ORGANISM="Alexandrium margalefi, Strain AMGDE01CS-322" /LENGTH=51 /DNA_ID=CAMNT_0051618083 /DNA_START=133 /DNA_END=285 /DNA_ORIENTATION=+